MADQLDLAVARKGTYLLHCRPRITFHLGHVRMLNVLYRLLVAGNRVVILIIPYDEHEPTNATIRQRLSEETQLTAAFYRTYLGFDEPHLEVISAADLPLSAETMRDVQVTYASLYEQRDSAVVQLIDIQQRAWASPNILFVPKCIASIERLRPDFLIAGAKHRPITECFDAILKRRNSIYESYIFEDLLDLRMKTGMDRTDSINSYIEISEHEDFILHKLGTLRDDPAQRDAWLDHFFDLVYPDAPERTKNGIGAIRHLEPEKILTLTKFLSNIRQLVPYASEQKAERPEVVWSDDLYRAVPHEEQAIVERIAAALYASSGRRQLTLYRMYTGGRSGSSIFGVREYDDRDGATISNLSVLKVGQALDLKFEAANYRSLVERRRTAAFMALKGTDTAIEGLSGLAYEEASRYLGASNTSRLQPLHTLLSPGKHRPDEIRRTLEHLWDGHLWEVLHKHGRRIDVSSVQPALGEFLPASFRLNLHAIDDLLTTPLHLEARSRTANVLQAHLRITEVNLRKRLVRGYTTDTHEKVDISVVGANEAALDQLVPGREIAVEGSIIGSRRDYFETAVQGLGIERRGDALVMSSRVQVMDPIGRLEALLGREFHDFIVSPVHGDLHGGNILLVDGQLAIIDYGKMRTDWPALYDVAYLYADLKCRLAASRYDLTAVHAFERALGSSRTRRRAMSGLSRDDWDLIQLFEYSNQCDAVHRLGPPALFYTLLAAIFMGRLKFDIPDHERRVAMILASHALQRGE